jgi:tetratricopeptide (TPR) repeat protein
MRQSIIADPVLNAPDLSDEIIAKRLEDFQKARQEVINSNFDTLGGLNSLAQAKRGLGDLEGARVAWEYANLISPLNSLSFSNLAALYHFELNQYDKAEENYLISIANDPDDIPTIRNLFEMYFYSLKDNAKAEALLFQSIEANPEQADLYAVLARFYADIGRVAQAIQYYEKNLELNPANEAARREIERLQAELENQH